MIYLILIISLFTWSWCGFNYLKKQIEELQANLKFKTSNLWDALEAVEKDLREDMSLRLEKTKDYYGYLDREGNWRPLDKRR